MLYIIAYWNTVKIICIVVITILAFYLILKGNIMIKIEKEITKKVTKVRVTKNQILNQTNTKSLVEAAEVLNVKRQTIENWIKRDMSIKLYKKYFGEGLYESN